MKAVSIVIPVYNAQKYLNKCLDSVCTQTYKNLEIVVVDDGSTDESYKICVDYTKKFKNIRIIKKSNGGVSSARNRGIDEIKGEYVLFVDSDDWIEKDTVEKLVELYEKFNVDVILFGVAKICKEKIIKCTKYNEVKITEIKKMINKFAELIRNEQINSPFNKFFKTEIIKKNNIRFNKNITIGEDLLFNIEYFKMINSMYISNYILYNYRLDNENSITKKYIKNKYEQLSIVREKIKEFALYIKSDKLYKTYKYITLKNIFSCMLDFNSLNCKYTTNEKLLIIKKIKKENGKIILINFGFKFFIYSLLYSFVSNKLLLLFLKNVKN